MAARRGIEAKHGTGAKHRTGAEHEAGRHAPAGEPGQPGCAPGPAAPRRAAARPRMDADLQRHIGEQLRAMHHAVLDEKVPDRFVELLRALAGREPGRS